MRPVDIDMTGKIWDYVPRFHKTQDHDIERHIFIGPKGQELIVPFLASRSVDANLFSPREAEYARRTDAPSHRRPNQPATPRKTDRKITDQYTPDVYRRAITRACDSAGVSRWHPHQLRHNAATNLRREFGIESARCVLGHTSAAMTSQYAEFDMAKARDVIGKVG